MSETEAKPPRGIGYVAIQKAFEQLPEVTTWKLDTILQEPANCHLYEKCGFVRVGEEKPVNKAIDEAIRVTKPGGVIFFAFISVYAIMYANYFQGNWAAGEEENFTEDYKVKHFKEQLFTGYEVPEFEALFETKPVQWITTAGVDGILEPIEDRAVFSIPDKDFEAFCKWYLAIAEKRELLGCTNHLLYICRKR